MPVNFDQLKLYSPSLHTCSGQTGSGKTALLFSVADRIHQRTGKELYVILKEDDRRIEEYRLPEWIHSLNPGADHPLDSIILGDDWQRIAPARRAMADVNVVIDELLGVLRHNNIDYLLDVQTYASLDRNSIIRTDYRWWKKPYQDEVNFSRPELKKEASDASTGLINSGMDTAYLSSVNREGYEGMVRNIKLPSYWSDRLSTMHRRLTEEEIEQRKPVWERWRLF